MKITHYKFKYIYDGERDNSETIYLDFEFLVNRIESRVKLKVFDKVDLLDMYDNKVDTSIIDEFLEIIQNNLCLPWFDEKPVVNGCMPVKQKVKFENNAVLQFETIDILPNDSRISELIEQMFYKCKNKKLYAKAHEIIFGGKTYPRNNLRKR